MTKQEKIEEAYGADVWSVIDESVKVKILENRGGWTYEINESWLQNTKGIEIEMNGKYCRPKALQGIEDNNGWTKIESEGDLPKEKGLICEFLNKKKKTATYVSVDCVYDKDWFLRRYTHWRPKEILKMPIY